MSEDFISSQEQFLKEKVSQSDLEQMVLGKQKKFSGLLTREAAMKLVAFDEGFVQQKRVASRPMKLSSLKDGDYVTAVVRVKQINCSREFERDGRKGKVSNVLVGDDTAEKTLVLWGGDADFAERKLERNACLRIENALVKNGELHSNLYAKLSLEENPPSVLPDYFKPAVPLSHAREGEDFFARIITKGRLIEFERNGEKRFVLNLTVADDSGEKTLVCWNRNAVIVNFLTEGDVIKVERVSANNGELQASWNTHILAHAKNHSLKELEFTPLSQMKEGNAFVQIILTKLFEARVSRKCQSCGSQVPPEEEKCNCRGSLREVFFITAEATDAFDSSSKLRLVFFGEQAQDLLGLKQTLVSPQTIFDLKRPYLEGKTFKLKALAKKREDGRIELVAKQIRSW